MEQALDFIGIILGVHMTFWSLLIKKLLGKINKQQQFCDIFFARHSQCCKNEILTLFCGSRLFFNFPSKELCKGLFFEGRNVVFIGTLWDTYETFITFYYIFWEVLGTKTSILSLFDRVVYVEKKSCLKRA